MAKGQFRIQKIADVGTANPIVSRLSMGLFDIIKMAQIDDEAKETIKEMNFAIIQYITKAEKIGLQICNDIDKVVKKLNEEGIKTQSFGRCVNVPSTDNLDNIREFLKYGKQSLQELVKIFNLFLKTNYSNPRYDKLLNKLEKQYGVDDSLTKMVKEYYKWIKKFLDFRNEDEHPKHRWLYFDFDIRWDKSSQRWMVILPRFYEGTPIYDFVKTSIHNLFTFAEEVNILFLEKTMPNMVKIYEIPESERKKDCEIRFRLGLKKEFAKKLR